MPTKLPPTVTVIRPEDMRPGWAYPYLPAEWDWEVRMIPFDLVDKALACTPDPTLRLVKDDKLVDIHVAGMGTDAFLAYWGLRPSMMRGGYLLSKRLARLFQPYLHFALLDPAAVQIVHDATLDGALWDGCGRMSRAFLERTFLPRLASLPERERRRAERELARTQRWEITLLHPGGMEKGDCLVCDDLPDGADFLFPVGSAKTELAQAGQVFVGLLAPRHAQVGMRLDPQSLVNLHPFFAPEALLTWTQQESELFLEALASGQVGRAYSRLVEDAPDEAALERLAGWHVGEFLASGGDVRWFAGITRAVGGQHAKRLVNQTEGKLRFPAPGGRFYLFPAAVGGRSVPAGQVELDLASATAWVNDADWCAFLVNVLGGCDGDDAVWVFPFTDWDGVRKLLLWRSPNQPGEWAILLPTGRSAELAWAIPGGALSWPEADSRLLPPRVDTVAYSYDALVPLERALGAPDADIYSVAAMEPTMQQAIANRGVLGSWCNLTMLLKALDGALPTHLPARLETIIDGSVKKFLDLTPVRAWVEAQARAIVEDGVPVPVCLLSRLLPLLPRRLRDQVQTSSDHWLDDLTAGVRAHLARYEAEVERLTACTLPPPELFQAVDAGWLPLASELRQRYGEALRRGGSLAAARRVSEEMLAGLGEAEQHTLLLATAAACYTLGQAGEGVCDSVLWQVGERTPAGRAPGIAQASLAALRSIGILGTPVWTSVGGVLAHEVERPASPRAVAVQVNGTWFNWLRATYPDTPNEMSDVPPATRTWAKQQVACLAAGEWQGLRLAVRAQEGRLVLETPHGNLFGYVQRGQEARLAARRAWRVGWATAKDGNVQLVMQPVA